MANEKIAAEVYVTAAPQPLEPDQVSLETLLAYLRAVNDAQKENSPAEDYIALALTDGSTAWLRYDAVTAIVDVRERKPRATTAPLSR